MPPTGDALPRLSAPPAAAAKSDAVGARGGGGGGCRRPPVPTRQRLPRLSPAASCTHSETFPVRRIATAAVTAASSAAPQRWDRCRGGGEGRPPRWTHGGRLLADAQVRYYFLTVSRPPLCQHPSAWLAMHPPDGRLPPPAIHPNQPLTGAPVFAPRHRRHHSHRCLPFLCRRFNWIT